LVDTGPVQDPFNVAMSDILGGRVLKKRGGFGGFAAVKIHKANIIQAVLTLLYNYYYPLPRKPHKKEITKLNNLSRQTIC